MLDIQEYSLDIGIKEIKWNLQITSVLGLRLKILNKLKHKLLKQRIDFM